MMLLKYWNLGVTAIIAVSAIIVIIAILVCKKRTLERSLFRFAVNLVSAILAIVLARPIASIFKNLYYWLLTSYLDYLSITIPRDIEKNEVIINSFKILLSAVVSLVFFYLLYLLFNIILGIAVRILFSKTEGHDLPAVSALVGGLSTALTVFLLFSPLVAITTSAAQDIDTVRAADKYDTELAVYFRAGELILSDDISEEDFEDIKRIANKRINAVCMPYNAITAFRCDGAKTNLHEAVYGICTAAKKAFNLPISTGKEFKFDAEHLEIIKDASEILFKSPFLRTISLEALHDACSAWSKEKTYLGFEDPFADTRYSQTKEELYKTLKNVSAKKFDDAIDDAITSLKTRRY